MTRRHVFALAAVAILIAATVALFSRRQLTFTITFNDANGIRAGQSVYYGGARIGEVTRVTTATPTAVDVRIGRDYEGKLHKQLSFFVERESILGGGRRLVAYDCSMTEAGAPIVRGDIIQGNESMMAWAACKGAESAGPFFGAAAALVSGLAATGPGRAIADSIKTYSESARRMGDEQWETFRRERLPALEKEARAYKERLEKDGRLDEARRFWEQFTAWLKQATDQHGSTR
jgi:hypothetical protein